MKVLQTAGQIAVHQVAANGFSAVRQGGGVKQGGATKKSIGNKGGAGRSDQRVLGSGIQPTKNAYEIAKAGGKHKGMYQNYLTRSPKELQKSIRSYQSGKRGINVHRDKITNPRKYDPNWDTHAIKKQQAQLNNWQEEISNATEQIQILQGILKEQKP